MKKIVCFLVVMSFTVLSCSKEETPTVTPTVPVNYSEENSYYSFLSKVIPNATIDNVVLGIYMELGYEFSPITNGIITSVEIRIPGARGNTSIHIWDSETRNLLHTEVINVQTGGVIYKKNIAGVPLRANKKYIISMASDSWYRYVKSEGSKIPRPYTAGNIVVGKDANATADSFPTTYSGDRYHDGGVCFNFLRTN